MFYIKKHFSLKTCTEKNELNNLYVQINVIKLIFSDPPKKTKLKNIKNSCKKEVMRYEKSRDLIASSIISKTASIKIYFFKKI